MSEQFSLIERIFLQLLKKFDFTEPTRKQWVKEDEIEYISELDVKINDFVSLQIKEHFPRAKIISEEGSAFDYSGSFWVIDPLDGTHNFLGGSPNFGICLAYCHNGEITSGGILLPQLNERWVVHKHHGVFLNTKPFKKELSPGKKFAFCDSNLRRVAQGTLSLFRELSLAGFSVRLTGCSALDFTLLAKGAGVLLVDKPHLWDIAPGVLIMQELLNQTVDSAGNPWKVMSDSLIVLSSLETTEEKRFWRLLADFHHTEKKINYTPHQT